MLKFVWIILLMGGGMSLYAGTVPGVVTRFSGDSLLPVVTVIRPEESVIPDLARVEEDYSKSGNERRALVRLLRMVKYRRVYRDMELRARLLKDLAEVSVRLKLYPLAMSCYARMVSKNEGDTGLLADQQGAEIGGGVWDDTLWQVGKQVREAESERINGQDIWEAFNDGKTAVSYALLVHVKQPAPGKRRAFTGINNVGHTFVTLIKYNSDHSEVCRSFGFYPHKSSLLAATPLHPSAVSEFRNDSLHEWDEVVGKYISLRKFQRIIGMIKRYNLSVYNLNQNNCTTFGLDVAVTGGINIRDTRGRWPLGRGSNPGGAGQSILEGNFSNIDPDDKAPLFVSRSAALAGISGR